MKEKKKKWKKANKVNWIQEGIIMEAHLPGMKFQYSKADFNTNPHLFGLWKTTIRTTI